MYVHSVTVLVGRACMASLSPRPLQHSQWPPLSRDPAQPADRRFFYCAAAFEQRTAEAVSAGVFLSTSRRCSWATASPETDQTETHSHLQCIHSRD